MKKYILVFACAAFVTSCKKIQAGGNKDALSLHSDVERYSDESAPKPSHSAIPDSLNSHKSVSVEPSLEKKEEVNHTPKESE